MQKCQAWEQTKAEFIKSAITHGKQAVWLSEIESTCGWWRGNHAWLKVQGVTLKLDSAPAESPGDGLPVLKAPRRGGRRRLLLLSSSGREVRKVRGARVRPGGATRVGDRAPRLRGWSWVEGAAAWPGWQSGWMSGWVGGYQFVLLSLVFSSQAEGRLNLERCHYRSLFPSSMFLSLLVLLKKLWIIFMISSWVALIRSSFSLY